MSTLQIGELAGRFGLPVETVRYYERAGLLPASARTSGNYRAYNASHVEQLGFVVNCRALDMTQDEIRRLLQLRAEPKSGCKDVNALIDEHIRDISKRISDLNALLTDLRKLRRSCNQAQADEDCKILKSLHQASAPIRGRRTRRSRT